MGIDRSFLDQFNEHFEKINLELEKISSSRIPLLKDMFDHSLLGKGKRLRPLLFLLSSRLCGYEGEDAYRLSTLFECIHTASLLHDDVLDNAELRRQKPSAKNIWGNLAAVLGGDYLYCKATCIAAGSENLGLFRLLSETTAKMVEGQFLEFENTHNWRMKKEDYMEVIIAKTAALISAACASGAIVAGAESEMRDRLSGFGLNLGIAFQLTDDILDYTSSQENFGKPVGKDLKEGKITLPLIYTLEELGESETKRLEERFKSGESGFEDHAELIAMVRGNSVIARIAAEAAGYVDAAAEYLERFPASSAKECLLALNAYVVQRDF